MIFELLRLFFKSIISNKSNFIINIIIELISLTFSLYIFYVTGQLVDKGNIQDIGPNYFNFLLIGEISLIIIVSYFQFTTDEYLKFRSTHFLETIENSDLNYLHVIRQMSIPKLISPVFRIFAIILIAKIYFQFQFSLSQLISFFIIQALSFLSIIPFIRMIISIHIIFNRGFKLFYTLNSILTFLGGAYFPIRFLPLYVQNYIVWLFPQGIIIKISRSIFEENNNFFSIQLLYFCAYILVIWIIEIYLRKKLNKIKLTRDFRHVDFSYTCKTL